jgi:hypothetical protein
MPINDSNPWDAVQNCALCCVAGIRGTTAETERQAIHNQWNVRVPDDESAMVFYEVAVSKLGEGRDLTNPACLRKQVKGVAAWMAQAGYNISYIGSVDNPLQPDAAHSAMRKYPNGTAFVYLIIDAGGQGEAHWIVARKNAGTITFTDYQLDIDMANSRDIKRKSERPKAAWGQASVTNEPREAWGDNSRGTNRMMVIALDDAPVKTCCCCYITTAVCSALGLSDDCEELQTLRWFRDRIVLATEAGRGDVATYYASAPGIVCQIDAHPHAALIYRELYENFIGPAVTAIKTGSYEAAYALFKACVSEASRRARIH